MYANCALISLPNNTKNKLQRYINITITIYISLGNFVSKLMDQFIRNKFTSEGGREGLGPGQDKGGACFGHKKRRLRNSAMKIQDILM